MDDIFNSEGDEFVPFSGEGRRLGSLWQLPTQEEEEAEAAQLDVEMADPGVEVVDSDEGDCISEQIDTPKKVLQHLENYGTLVAAWSTSEKNEEKWNNLAQEAMIEIANAKSLMEVEGAQATRNIETIMMNSSEAMHLLRSSRRDDDGVIVIEQQGEQQAEQGIKRKRCRRMSKKTPPAAG